MPSAKDLTLENLNTKILIVGESGTGKSHFLSTLPKPIFLFDTDKCVANYAGLDVDYEEFDLEESEDLKIKKGVIDPSEYKAWDKFVTVLHALEAGTYNGGKKYASIVLDSVTTLTNMAFNHTVWRSPESLKAKMGFEVHIKKADKLETAVRKLRNLDSNLAIAGHIKVTDEESTGMSKVTIDAPGRLQNFIPALMDIMLFTQIQNVGQQVNYQILMKPTGKFRPRVRMNGTDINKMPASVANNYDAMLDAINLAKG